MVFYMYKVFGIYFLIFLVVFIVMCLGIILVLMVLNVFVGFLNDGFGLGLFKIGGGILIIVFGFMVLVVLINFCGVGESVKVNVVLICIEFLGLLMIIFIGFYVMS